MILEKFDNHLIQKIISLHDSHFDVLPADHGELYESQEAIMWDGYIQPIVDLHEAIDAAFRYNTNIKLVDIGQAFKQGEIEKLSIEEVGFIFRDILVNEKFHLGLFADVIIDGRLSRLVNRLKEVSRPK